ncbi:hypothetical protein [Ornithinimicrobium kibberense]|uniref:hypothetical protein n=1 Tax=Ornithinimicrobium kibberense TaxID=282060 RepID=UPI0036074622
MSSTRAADTMTQTSPAVSSICCLLKSCGGRRVGHALGADEPWSPQSRARMFRQVVRRGNRCVTRVSSR